jgi:hypothetical protein
VGRHTPISIEPTNGGGAGFGVARRSGTMLVAAFSPTTSPGSPFSSALGEVVVVGGIDVLACAG